MTATLLHATSQPVSSQSASKYFNVLYQTTRHVVIQTHTGEVLSDAESDANISSFGAFNLGLHVGDDPTRVLANRQRLLIEINDYVRNIGSNNSVTVIHWLNQVHGNQVINNVDDKPLRLIPYSADAMISHSSQTALAIITADCVPIAIVSEQTGQMANIHAGWQGLANGVIGKTCEALQSVENCTAIIGACISQDSYEVSLDVANKVLAGCKQMGLDVDRLRHIAVGSHTDDSKAWLDLPAIATAQLEHFGINVINSGLCSYQNHTHQSHIHQNQHQNYRYYSHRRMTHLKQQNTGRMALVVARVG